MFGPVDAILTDARRGRVEVVRPGVTFERLAHDWLVYGQHERDWRPATLVDRRSGRQASLGSARRAEANRAARAAPTTLRASIQESASLCGGGG